MDVNYPFEPIHMTVISTFAVGIPSVLITLQNNTKKLEVSFLKHVLGKAIPFGVSIAVAEICLIIAGEIIIQQTLSFAFYVVAGFIAFCLLFDAGKPHNKLSLLYTCVLFLCFLSTFLLNDFLNLGIINATAVIAAVAGVIIALIIVLFIRKTVRF